MRRKMLPLLSILALLALSLPAAAPGRSSQVLGTPLLPFSPYGLVQHNGFNLAACSDDISGCPDVQAHCGSFTFSYGQVILDSGKSWYAMDIPFDDPETAQVDGCATNEDVTFTIKDELAEQAAIPWQEGSSLRHDIAFGSPIMVFLPLIQR